MININRHNYEEVFIDYLDGNLDYHVVAELMLFLSENPDLDAELDGLQGISINNKPNKLPIKHLLKKEEGTLSGSAIDDKCVAKLEGDLSKNELKEFNFELFNNAELRNNLLLVLKTKLKKDENIVFPLKDELKKQKERKLYIKGFYRYAAMFIPAIIFSILYLNYSNNSNNTTNSNNFTANNSVNKQAVKSNTKKVESNDFKIIKTETPSIVSNSIHINEKIADVQLEKEVQTEKIRVSSTNIFIDPVNRFIDERKELAELSSENISVSTKKEKVQNIYIDPYNFTTNEIQSDELIHKSMEKLKFDDNNKLKETNSFGENLAETFSNITTVFQFEKEKVDDGKVYRLAFNSKNFEIGRIKKKKE